MKEQRPTNFDEAMTKPVHELRAASGDFKLQLSATGSVLGWMGHSTFNYAHLVANESEGVILELYPYGGTTYIRAKGTSRYLSVSNLNYVGFYLWTGATGWKFEGTNLISNHNNEPLSLFSKDDGYLYAQRSERTVLDVKRIEV